jgi:hypothetical protein
MRDAAPIRTVASSTHVREGIEMDMRSDRGSKAAVAAARAPAFAARKARGFAWSGGVHSPRPGIRWSAAIVAAAVSAALALVLLVMCVGLKLTSVSPWVGSTSTTLLGATTIGAAVLVQLVASVVGGYVAGCLRSLWPAAVTTP